MRGATFAPNDDESNPLYKTDSFRMNCFKVLPCSKRFCHDWTTCPFAHPAEKAKRRDPRAHLYTGVACPEMKKNTTCPRGDSCTFAHNVFEYWLHPSRYRTQLCNEGINCTRKICFFAHTMDELRVSSVKVVPPDSVAAKLACSPSGSDAFDGLDPFSSSHSDESSAKGGGPRSSTSPVSPLCGDLWDASGSSDASSSSRRSSLQLQQKQKQAAAAQRQRMSLDQMATRPAYQQHQQQLLQHQRGAVDLAELQLTAMKAQLAMQQQAAGVDQLAHALAQLQLASSLAGTEHVLPAVLQQAQQQAVQQQAQQLVMQMLLQQQLQGQMMQGSLGGVGDPSGSLGAGMFAPGNPASVAMSIAQLQAAAAASRAGPGSQGPSGGGAGPLADYGAMCGMPGAPPPPGLHDLCGPAAAPQFAPGPLFSPPMAPLDSVYSSGHPFPGHRSPSSAGSDDLLTMGR